MAALIAATCCTQLFSPLTVSRGKLADSSQKIFDSSAVVIVVVCDEVKVVVAVALNVVVAVVESVVVAVTESVVEAELEALVVAVVVAVVESELVAEADSVVVCVVEGELTSQAWIVPSSYLSINLLSAAANFPAWVWFDSFTTSLFSMHSESYLSPGHCVIMNTNFSTASDVSPQRVWLLPTSPNVYKSPCSWLHFRGAAP